MDTRRLGDDGPEVGIVGLGTNNFGRACDLPQTRAVIDAALDEGIGFIDTADVYGQGGLSEQYIGEVLEGRRDRVFLATKFGMDLTSFGLDPPEVSRGSREYIRWAIEKSLHRLRTDRIDLYQMHFPDPETPIEETLIALNELIDEGSVRFIGASNFSAAQIDEAERVARERGLERFISTQAEYSLVHRDAEAEILPACERNRVGFIPYFPLAAGLLTGKYTTGQLPSEGRLLDTEIPPERIERVAALQSYADERGVSLLEVAIGGLAAVPGVASVIAGATKPEQVRANVRAGQWRPTASDLGALLALE